MQLNTSSIIVKPDPYATLRIPEFRFYILIRFLATIGLQIQAVVIAWKIYETTQNVLSLGYIGLAEAIPALSIALYAGLVVDRNDRRNVALISLSVLLLCSVSFLLSITSSTPSLVSILYIIIFITGIARGFLAPSMFTLLPQIVTRDQYSNATTWNSSSWQIGAVAGPALGGLLYAVIGISKTLLIVVVFMVISVFLLSRISSKGKPEVNEKESILQSLWKGIDFVFSTKVILGALSLDLFAVLFGGAVALLPVFAKEILHSGPEALGMLRAAPSIGAFSTMIWMAHNPPVERAGRNLLLCVAGFGLCIICFALSRNFYLSMGLLILSGAFDSVSVVVRSTILQLKTPENMRGRVSAVNTMFIGSSNEIGSFESGVTAKWMGLIPSVIFGGCMTIFVVIFTAVKAPSLRELNLKASESEI